MVGKPMFRKVKMYPRPHQFTSGCAFELDDGNIDSTIFPLVMYDEGKGAPDSYNSHPEHSSFALGEEPNCFVGSKIRLINSKIRFSITSKFKDDNLLGVRCAFMPIFMAFKEDYDAIDELSTLEIKDVLMMQYETTDNQGYPLFNGNKMAEIWTDSGLQATNVPGLTTNQKIEGVSFSPGNYYKMLHYLTNSGKLKKCQGGLKWFTLTQRKPIANISLKIRPKVKAMNKFTFFGVLAHVQTVDTNLQMVHTRDITAATQYVDVHVRTTYDEENQGFDHEKV